VSCVPKRAGRTLATLSMFALLGSCGTEAPPPPPIALETVLAKLDTFLGAPSADGLTEEQDLVDPSGHALDAFGQALLRAARHEGVAHLAFFGGSHTASDFYTGEIRARLQHRFGDAGHGFVFAAMPITDYWQWGVRVADGDGWDIVEPSLKHFGVDTYGLAGMAFDANVPAWASVETERTTASHLELLYLQQPNGGTIDVRIDDVHVETIDTSSEHTEAGLHVYGVADASHRIEIETDGSRPVRVYGFVFERDTDHGVVVDQLGLAGSKARHQLFWDHELWRTFLASRRPDLISLSYGNNEGDDRHLTTAQHIEHFRSVVQRIRQDFPHASCLVIGPTERQLPDETGAYVTPTLLGELAAAQRVIAGEEGCAFFDTMAWQCGPGAVDRWLACDPPLQRDDHIHLMEPAYRRLGASILRSMVRALRRPSPSPAPR
jgi:hypothetical protein